MIRTLFTAAAITLIATSAAPAEEELTPKQIQDAVRYSYSLQNADLKGQLRRGSETIPFEMTLNGSSIQFKFSNPDQVVELVQQDDRFVLQESLAGRPMAKVAPSRYGDAVRGTDVNYEDLAMRFLYWDRVELLGTEIVGGRKAWKLHIKDSAKVGPYSQVYIWVDQKAGGMSKMEGYDWDGYRVKRFEVTGVQKIGDSWTVKKMKVESFAPGTGKLVGRTSLLLLPKS